MTSQAPPIQSDGDFGFLNPLEIEAILLSGKLANMVGKIVGNDVSREHDLGELAHHIHVIQRYIMSNAAARAYPDLCRALGQTIPSV